MQVLLDPQLTKETLMLLMQVTDCQTGRITYAWVGFGQISSALGLHALPSDLDIFLIMALSRYIAFTGDVDFLNESVPFYPSACESVPPGAQGTTVRDHLNAAFVHLTESVGFGPHGLIRIGDGDWDDGIVVSSDPDPLAIFFSIEYGESIPNSQMAISVCQTAAPILQPYMPELAVQLLDLAQSLEAPVQSTFNGFYYQRAWLRDAVNEPYAIGNTSIQLESQVWAFLMESVDASTKLSLLKQIESQLNSPIGPRIAVWFVHCASLSNGT